MNLIKLLAANKYFTKKTSKVFCVDALTFFPSEMSRCKGYGKLLPFQISKMNKRLKYRKWVKHSLGVCYNHCSSLLLGLNLDDKCVFGRLDYNENYNFYHAWNEFEFNNTWYVYECSRDVIYEKDTFYKQAEPTAIKSWTLQDVLNRYQKYKTTENKKEKIILPHFKMNNEEEIKDIPALRGCNIDFFYKDSEITLKNNEIVSAKVEAWDLD